ncbi:hypothetical protein F5Y16DRAFT_364777 [Xylariaceae sp. FL0255]|nr:hypothetical protein F5Y16DRAFT_364777 [Xylariaceae sp. FL0255]
MLTSPDGNITATNINNTRQWVSSNSARQVLYLCTGTKAWQTSVFGALEKKIRRVSEPINMYKRPYEGAEDVREAMQGYP